MSNLSRVPTLGGFRSEVQVHFISGYIVSKSLDHRSYIVGMTKVLGACSEVGWYPIGEMASSFEV